MSDKKKKEIESEMIKRLIAEFVMSGGEITQVADGMISTPTKLNQNDYYSKMSKVDDDRRKYLSLNPRRR
jgi:hypothetical protein